MKCHIAKEYKHGSLRSNFLVGELPPYPQLTGDIMNAMVVELEREVNIKTPYRISGQALVDQVNQIRDRFDIVMQ